MISYAQNFEDVILNRCFAGRNDGFYIDIGAMDPVDDSVTKFFYDQGWCGINVEPNEWFYSKLQEQRPRDINLNVAVGDREHEKAMYIFEQFGVSTFDPAYCARFVERGFEVKQKNITITTLASICEKYVDRRIDFLKIDCEGWEKYVIRGADWDRFRPAVVLVEAIEPLSTTPSWSEWESLLVDTGQYEMVYFDGVNRFYMTTSQPELRRCYQLPPNIFDGIKMAATHHLEIGRAHV